MFKTNDYFDEKVKSIGIKANKDRTFSLNKGSIYINKYCIDINKAFIYINIIFI